MVSPTTIHKVRMRIAARKIGDRFSSADIAKELNTITSTAAGNILKWQPEVRKVRGSKRTCGMKCSINPYEWEKIAEIPEALSVAG